MKCVKNRHTGEVTRMSNTEAKRLVETGDWIYVTREEWRKASRPRRKP